MSARTEKRIRKLYGRELNKVAGKDFDLYRRMTDRMLSRYRIAVIVLAIAGIVGWVV